MPLNNPAAVVEIKDGSYTGNSSVNRAIPHGLSKTPTLVLITGETDQTYKFWIHKGVAKIYHHPVAAACLAVTAPDSTNFYVGNATQYNQSANLLNNVHYWVAIG